MSRVHSAAEHCIVSEVLLLLGDTQVEVNFPNKCLEILNYLNFKKSVLPCFSSMEGGLQTQGVLLQWLPSSAPSFNSLL